jgi:hypothetical protein
MRAEVETSPFREELQRVLTSETLRSSEALRRLLSYLAEAYLSGTARNLKEYMIGRDAMGKPADYDPRVDASVRVQIGKLRQRLDQYYTTEASDAAVQIKLPRGHFELTLETVTPRTPPLAAPEPPSAGPWKTTALALAGVVVVLIVVLALLLPGRRSPLLQGSAALLAEPDFREFWAPFLESERPLIAVLGSPLFVRFHNHYFRNPWVNDWESAQKEIPIEEMRRLLQAPTAAAETHRWAPFGEAASAFRLAMVLGPSRQMVLKRSITLAWEDVRSSNLIFLGPAKFNPQLRHLPVELDFDIDAGRVHNLRPRPGEAEFYEKPSAPNEEDIPEDYVLITRFRGVPGWGEVLALACSSTEGTWAAADYVTTPAQVRDLMRHLRAQTGSIPDSYQVLLKSRFKRQVPIQTDYVTHHVIRTKPAQ